MKYDTEKIETERKIINVQFVKLKGKKQDRETRNVEWENI